MGYGDASKFGAATGPYDPWQNKTPATVPTKTDKKKKKVVVDSSSDDDDVNNDSDDEDAWDDSDEEDKKKKAKKAKKRQAEEKKKGLGKPPSKKEEAKPAPTPAPVVQAAPQTDVFDLLGGLPTSTPQAPAQ